MSHRVLVFVSAVTVLVALVSWGVAPAAAQTTVPRTAWGQPDLQGVWDFRTITPLERPEDLADREFLTEEEAANLEQEAVDRNIRLLNRPARRTTAGGNVDRQTDGTPGFYNNFWLDRGTNSVSTGRTSLIVDPPNGRLPALSANGQRRADARREYLREHPADSWLDRSTSDRCLLGFNAGPPITPAGYNQNMHSSSRLPTTSYWSPRWSTRLASCLSMDGLRSERTSASGRGTRVATGRAIPWWSKPLISTTSDGGEVLPRT